MEYSIRGVFSIDFLVLTRKVKVEKYEVLMEIGRQQRMEELHAVLMLAKQKGDKVTAANICDELLLGKPESVGKAIIDRCCYFDLLEHNGALTSQGDEALRTQKIFVPEKARYMIWYTEDPLISQRLLHLEAVKEPSAHDELYAMNKKNMESKEAEKEVSENVTEKLGFLKRKTFDLMGSTGGRTTILKLSENGITRKLVPEDDLRVTLRINIILKTLHLSLEGKFNYILMPPSINFEKAWIDALGPQAKFWKKSRIPPALNVSFKGLNENELSSFRKTVQLVKPKVDPYESFDDTSVDAVPIIPASLEDAAQWAKRLLKNSISTYLNSEKYQELVNSCKSKFPDFENLELPTREELVHEMSKEMTSDDRLPPHYWYLQAPIDLQVTNGDDYS